MTADSYAQTVETVARAISDEQVEAAMRAFEMQAGPLRYREADGWHVRDRMAMRKALEAALAIHPETADAGAGEVQLDPGWLLKDVRAAASRMQPAPAPAISGGEMVSVPREPTNLMLLAGYQAANVDDLQPTQEELTAIYRAMLAAAGQKP